MSNSVSEVFRIADQLEITFDDVKDKNAETLCSMFFPDRSSVKSLYAIPEYDYVHSVLKRLGHSQVFVKLIQGEIFQSWLDFYGPSKCSLRMELDLQDRCPALITGK